MASFDALATIAINQGFQNRVQYAMSVAAIAVYNEGTGVTGHAARAAYAVKVLSANFNLQAATWGVLTNATIAAEANPATTPDFAIADTDIQFQVNSMWNALAGA